MAFKMKGFSAFTKEEEKEYVPQSQKENKEYTPQTQEKDKEEYTPQTKTGGREYEDKVRRSDLDEKGKEIFDSKGYEPQSTRIYLDDEYEVGDHADEDDFEAQFKQKGDKAKNYPQLSVEDYSTVKKDARGFYVTKKED